MVTCSQRARLELKSSRPEGSPWLRASSKEGEFAALLLEPPADVRDQVQCLGSTWWRRDEGPLLDWAAVDRGGGTIRLVDARSKSGKPRVSPFGLAPALK